MSDPRNDLITNAFGPRDCTVFEGIDERGRLITERVVARPGLTLMQTSKRFASITRVYAELPTMGVVKFSGTVEPYPGEPPSHA